MPAKLTRTPRPHEIERRWFTVDVEGQILGRAAAEIARVLRGKHKPAFTPHLDVGDFVIVLNASKVRFTGKKREGKVYYRYTGRPGGIRAVTLGRLLETHPERVIEGAVRGMLPKGPLGRKMFRKLKVYVGSEHPHAAQRPEPREIPA